MTGDGAVGIGVGDPEHAAASGPRSQNQRRLSNGHTNKAKLDVIEACRESLSGAGHKSAATAVLLLLEEPAEWDALKKKIAG